MDLFITRRGGGDNLNFDIVGGMIQPANPKENTIWVETEQEITGWTFCSDEPDEPVNGVLYFLTSVQSDISFNAIKKNALMVSPIMCFQYKDGVRVKRTALIYQNEDWVEWKYSYVKNGVLMQDLLVKSARWDSSDSNSGNNPTITQNDGYVSVAGTQNGYSMIYLDNIDLTDKEEIVIEGTFTVKTYLRLTIWSKVGSYVSSNIQTYIKLTETGARIDLTSAPLTGLYVVGLTTQAKNEQQITNFYIK